MICVPSLNYDSSFSVGPRDLIHSLSSLLAHFRGGNPAVINILRDKLTQLGITASSPQKLIDLSSSEDEREERYSPQRSITWSDSSSYSPTVQTTPIIELPPTNAIMDIAL
jgi:hypothetical protein